MFLERNTESLPRNLLKLMLLGTYTNFQLTSTLLNTPLPRVVGVTESLPGNERNAKVPRNL
jgi:hypothetical protein